MKNESSFESNNDRMKDGNKGNKSETIDGKKFQWHKELSRVMTKL